MNNRPGVSFWLPLLAALVLCLLQPIEVRAQGVGFDNATSADTAASAVASLTFSHTVSGSNRLLIVGVAIRNANAGDTVASVTYAGVNLTLVGAQSNSSSARSELWYLVAPGSGRD